MIRRARRRKDEPTSLGLQASAQRWDDFTLRAVRDQGQTAWLSDSWSYTLPMYWQIMKNVPRGGAILEVGTGGGPHLLWLAARGYRCTGVDYRLKPIEFARKAAQRLEVECRFEHGDAFDLSAYRDFDLAFSVGVIEHWPKEDSVRALAEQAACAHKVLAVIPTPNTRFAGEVTDERFYSRREFRSMMQEAGLSDIRMFAFGTVPTAFGRLATLIVPPAALKTFQNRTALLSMSHAAIGSSSTGDDRARGQGRPRQGAGRHVD